MWKNPVHSPVDAVEILLILTITNFVLVFRHMDKSSAQSFLPLSPARFHVLLALAGGDKHGYAILKDVSQLSEQKIRLSASTLYSVLDRLTEDALIEESGSRPDPALDDDRRRYHRLTPLGREVARLETERLEQVLSAARNRNLGPNRMNGLNGPETELP